MQGLPPMLPTPPPDQRRGGAMRSLLFVVLLVSVVTSIAGLWVAAFAHQDPGLLDEPTVEARQTRLLLLLAIAGTGNAGFAVGAWGWKRWGIYGVIVFSFFAFMINLKLGDLVYALPGLVGPVALTVVAAFLWRDFD